MQDTHTPALLPRGCGLGGCGGRGAPSRQGGRDGSRAGLNQTECGVVSNDPKVKIFPRETGNSLFSRALAHLLHLCMYGHNFQLPESSFSLQQGRGGPQLTGSGH